MTPNRPRRAALALATTALVATLAAACASPEARRPDPGDRVRGPRHHLDDGGRRRPPRPPPTARPPRDPQAQADLDQRLRDAAWANDVAAARDLIARGADVNAKDDTQQSAYLVTTSEGYLDLLEPHARPRRRRREQGQLQRDRADPRRRAGAYRRRRPADPGRRRGQPREPAGLDRPARGDHPRQGHGDLRRHRAGPRGRRRRRAAAVEAGRRRAARPRPQQGVCAPGRHPGQGAASGRGRTGGQGRGEPAAARRRDLRRRRRRSARPARGRRPGDDR